MKPLAKLGYLAAACALLVATFAIIGPPAVRAAVATLVQVVNTTTNPVPNADVNAPGEEPFQLSVCTAFTGFVAASCGPLSNAVQVPTTTSDGLPVKRMVIEGISWICYLNGGQVNSLYLSPYTVANASPTGYSNINLPVFSMDSTGTGLSSTGVVWPTGSMLVRGYADPGSSIPLNGTATAPTGENPTCVVSVFGNLITH